MLWSKGLLSSQSPKSLIVIMWFVLTHQAARLRSNDAKVGYKPFNVLPMCFPRPKDNPTPLQCRGVVYKVGCVDCNFV